MNLRLQNYKLYRIHGLSAYKAAILAGYSHATAWNAHKNIEKRCNFDELMVKEGLDDQTLMQVLYSGIMLNRAGKPTLVTKMFLELALKLNGTLKDKVEHSGKMDVSFDGELNVNLNGKFNDFASRISQEFGCSLS